MKGYEVSSKHTDASVINTYIVQMYIGVSCANLEEKCASWGVNGDCRLCSARLFSTIFFNTFFLSLNQILAHFSSLERCLTSFCCRQIAIYIHNVMGNAFIWSCWTIIKNKITNRLGHKPNNQLHKLTILIQKLQ